ncbi:hypothetical protein HAD_05880 [Hyphomonas adhaerens MHS-3]|uniref:LRAT domain-containing protein n=1 Tax=Hyphomonas adhaerens MHS-3 TaxID=1280949 RepID=A0A069E576_9PROT|nr:lecithin retinol acyltransferase family protein [Hyphomonas adhaerens]KCZ85187.1 hypothetical protein HAD_05880 [Hyphomonas adhaerens MHS-3]
MQHDPFTAGDVVSIRFGGVLRHYGVITGRGTVICNSRLHGGVVEQSLDTFSDGRNVRLHGRYSDLDGYHVEQRARRHLGKEYDLFGSNCGHFVRHAHRRKPTPMQVAAATVRTFGDMLGRPKRRY